MGNRPRIYIAGPITGGVLADNIKQATDAFYALLRLGYAPLCPHWSVFSGDPYIGSSGSVFAYAERLPRGTKHSDWMGADLPWVEVADAVLRLPGDSPGADAEVAHAIACGVPVFERIEDLDELWFGETPKAKTKAKTSHTHTKTSRTPTVTKTVAGVGQDAPTVTNASGGKQSSSPYRADLLPPLATLAVSSVLKAGAAKYGDNNWHAIPLADHINHALVHLFAQLAGDTQDDHLEHAACRLLMALETRLRPCP